MIKLFLFLSFWQTDTTEVFQTDTIQSKSILFINEKETELIFEQYQHQQGFFCDFEDQINKQRKLRLNVGVGEQ